MNPIAEAALTAECEMTALAVALASWYANQSSVRRLWAIEGSVALKILIALEPTADGGDILPVWLANHSAWLNDLRMLAQREVELQPLAADALIDAFVNPDAIKIADVRWREMTP
jgi:hypothetical protein